MDQLRAARAERADIEAFEQAEVLEHDRALPPRARFADLEAAVANACWSLERRPPGRQVVAGEQPSMGPKLVWHFLGSEGIDGFRYEAFVKGSTRSFQLPITVRACRLRFGQDPPKGEGKRLVS